MALDIMVEKTAAERGIILVYSEENKLLFKAGRNAEKKNIERPEAEVSTFTVQQARQTKRSVFSPDAVKDPKFDPSKSISSLHIRSIICAPLKFGGEVGISGVIYLDHREREGLFKDDTKRLLRKLAVFVSLAVQNALEKRQLLELQQKLQDELKGYGEIIGLSQAMQEIYKLIEKVAATDARVLITGESGTGKERIAHELHRKSARRNQKYEPLNCAELAPSLLESELFGIEEKTATGVKKHIGFIERANGGTLFIDEVGDMPMNVQVKLLRVLQEHSLRRVGGEAEIPIDLRIVAATNRNLEELIKQGQFREDLFYRLSVVEIRLPPLRERGEDILLLARSFVRRFAKQPTRPVLGISKAAEELLLHYHWPGNVRELQHAIEHAVILTESEIIQVNDLPRNMQIRIVEPPELMELTYAAAKENWEKGYFKTLLQKTNGNIAEAARLAGMDRSNLWKKLRDLGISPKDSEK